MIKLIVFDLWHTLIYRATVLAHTTETILKDTKVNMPLDKFRKIFEEVVQTKRWETEMDAYMEFARRIGISPTERNVMKIMSIRDRDESKTKLYNFTIPLLKQLRGQKYKIGLLSNSSVFSIETVRKETNILDYIDYPLFAYEIGVIKPDPLLFVEMQRRAKVKATEMLMIGDSLSDDVIPARELGIKAIHFKGNYEELKEDLKKLDIFVQ